MILKKEHEDMAKKLVADWLGESGEIISTRGHDILIYYTAHLLARTNAQLIVDEETNE